MSLGTYCILEYRHDTSRSGGMAILNVGSYEDNDETNLFSLRIDILQILSICLHSLQSLNSIVDVTSSMISLRKSLSSAIAY